MLTNRIRAAVNSRVVRVVATAAVLTSVLIGVALASTFTVKVAKNASVTDAMGTATTENIVTTGRGRAVYELSGDSRSDPKCRKSNGCFQFWPPVTVSSKRRLSKGPGVKGRLGTWRRNGILQVTLSGHPLYRFAGDSQADHATGDGQQTFGGTWHVVKAVAGTGTATSTTPMTTTPGGCLYPPCT